MIDLNRKQAKLHISLSASPTLSLSDPNAILSLTVAVSIASTDDTHQNKPLTISMENNVLQERNIGDDGIDIFGLRQSAFTVMRCASGDTSKWISFGSFHVNFGYQELPDDLRERRDRFLTVPAKDGDASRVASITHKLDLERIFRYEERRTKDDLVPGEVFQIGMVERCLNTYWWCWGDLDGDLKGKKFHYWHPTYPEEKPDTDDSWVLGENPRTLDWEDVTEGGKATFTIVE